MKEFQVELLKRLDRVADTFDRLATVLTYESDGRANPTITVHTPPVPVPKPSHFVSEEPFGGSKSPPPMPMPMPTALRPEPDKVGFTFAESGEEYQQRQSRDAAFAISLGVAPWSRDFQTTIMQMKYDLMRTHMENRQDAEGNWRAVEAEGRSEEEAEQIVKDAFRLARAEANVRQVAAV